jgi:hypothetical protein
MCFGFFFFDDIRGEERGRWERKEGMERSWRRELGGDII